MFFLCSRKINKIKKREKRIVNNNTKKEQHCQLVKEPGFQRVKSAWTFFISQRHILRSRHGNESYNGFDFTIKRTKLQQALDAHRRYLRSGNSMSIRFLTRSR